MTNIPLPIILKHHPDACKVGGDYCKICRMDSPSAANWREVQTGNREFECPFGKPMAVVAKNATTDNKKKSKCFRAELTLENARLAISSIHGRERVSDAIRAERLDACAKCNLKCTDDDGDFCGAGCGCGIGGRKPLVLRVAASLGWDADLTLYTEKNGGLCKHPKRHLGQGWGNMRA